MNHFGSWVEHVPDAVVIVNAAGQIVRINAPAERLFGYGREELLGQLVEVLLPEPFQLMGAVRELAGRRKTGEEFPVEICLGPLQTEEGCFVIGTIRDVSERRRTETRRAEELARHTREQGRLAYAMAHDLKEPLRAISSYARKFAAQVLGQPDEQARAFVERIVLGADRMREKIDGLLAYARVGTETRSFAWVECSEVFAAACAHLHPAVEESGARVTGGTLPRVWGQKLLLELLLTNLIGNAVKFRAAGQAPAVHVEARPQGEEWLVTVTDNGIGMKAEHLQRIFEIGMAARLHSIVEYPGHGLGLATCARIVERHGGRIWAESPGPGRGATLAFTLPAGHSRP
jgi:PAS domain S-box-containing protein